MCPISEESLFESIYRPGYHTPSSSPSIALYPHQLMWRYIAEYHDLVVVPITDIFNCTKSICLSRQIGMPAMDAGLWIGVNPSKHNEDLKSSELSQCFTPVDETGEGAEVYDSRRIKKDVSHSPVRVRIKGSSRVCGDISCRSSKPARWCCSGDR